MKNFFEKADLSRILGNNMNEKAKAPGLDQQNQE
jgi:hypothetical protein